MFSMRAWDDVLVVWFNLMLLTFPQLFNDTPHWWIQDGAMEFSVQFFHFHAVFGKKSFQIILTFPEE